MDLVIGFDYQRLVEQLRNLRKAKDFLATANTGPVETGWITCNYKYSPRGEWIEQICVTLEGEGPFYLLDSQAIRRILLAYDDFAFPEIGDIIFVGNLRLKVVDNNREYPYEFLVMLPDALSILMCAILPIARWVDLIYRRLILTASVWNLAEITPGQWPHWGHLKWSKEYKETKGNNT